MILRDTWLGRGPAHAVTAWTWLVGLVLLALTSGCRTPWRSINSEPSFDRLIEIERQASPRSAAREPLASQSRSSSAHAASPRPTSADAKSRAAQPPLSDDSEMEEMLVDVPPNQRDLLRREIYAQQVRKEAQSGSRTPASNEAMAEFRDDRSGDSAAVDRNLQTAKLSRASQRISDNTPPGADDWDAENDAENWNAKDAVAMNLTDKPTGARRQLTEDYQGSSKYQLAAHESKRHNRDEIPPRAIESLAERPLPESPQGPLNNVTQSQTAATAQRSEVVTASYVEPASPLAQEPAAQLSWREHVTQALALLEKEADAHSPEEKVHQQMVDRLLHMSLGDINAASEPIDGLQTSGQDFVRHSLESLYEVTNPNGNPVETKRYTLAMLSQRKALSHLAAVSNLEVRNATFCTEVDGFGVVSKFPQYNFQPDQELLLYCELDNFVSSKIEGKGYETQLQGNYEIVDANGRRVADQLLPMDSHLCRNQRRDYFIAYRIYMPQKIEPGKYQLKLTVEDMKGRKFGQSTLDFQITK